ncbi:methyltransferase domain-containing protein [Acetobacter musti]|uniref:Methyltransferase domain-containing protein n=1 Tax=Acetobacter musti TaxID=864732 RepID=A0ABX0JSR5_9PROT|nr:methyltransferase domain-containing protein [Acetobacter musti]NHN86216.1 methyltransferase domain-containing protein [Acetobacter musti]
MQNEHLTFDRKAVRLHRDRAASTLGSVADLLGEAADRLLERLDDLTRTFPLALDIGGRGATYPGLRARGIDIISCDFSPKLARQAPPPSVCVDEEFLPFGEHRFDLVVANLSLHWVNDLPGTFAQIRHILKPDGLFLASIPVLPTLSGLRECLSEAELAISGGVSPRISPFPALRDCASLLQRAGFALPVVDAETMDIRYRSGLALLRDLRAAGEGNAVALRDRRTPPASLFPAALSLFEDRHAGPDGTIATPLHMAILSAWAPAPSQPQPLAPGQFTTSLKDALEDNNTPT